MMSRNMAAGIQQWFTGYIFDIGHPCYGQLTAVKARYLNSITWPYRGLRFRVYWGLRFISVYRWPNKLFAIDFFLNLIPFFFQQWVKKIHICLTFSRKQGYRVAYLDEQLIWEWVLIFICCFLLHSLCCIAPVLEAKVSRNVHCASIPLITI